MANNDRTGNVVNLRNGDSGKFDDGVKLAGRMLRELEACEYADGYDPYALIPSHRAPGTPQQNLVLQFTKLSREGGADVEAGFTAALTDYVAGAAGAGCIRPAVRYSRPKAMA